MTKSFLKLYAVQRISEEITPFSLISRTISFIKETLHAGDCGSAAGRRPSGRLKGLPVPGIFVLEYSGLQFIIHAFYR